MCIGISVGKEDNMEADENLAAADNGSPSEEKSEVLSDFLYEYNDMILHLEPRFANDGEQTEIYWYLDSLTAHLSIPLSQDWSKNCTCQWWNDFSSITIKKRADEEIIEDTIRDKIQKCEVFPLPFL